MVVAAPSHPFWILLLQKGMIIVQMLNSSFSLLVLSVTGIDIGLSGVMFLFSLGYSATQDGYTRLTLCSLVVASRGCLGEKASSCIM